MKKLGLLVFILVVTIPLFAQNVAITDDSGYSADASAMLDVKSTDKGFLPPRVASTGDVTSPAAGLLVYQTGGTPGYYYYNGSSWIQLGSASGASQWTTDGSNIYYNSGNVGIGTSSPATDLDIVGNDFRLKAPSGQSSYLIIDNTDADQLSTISLQTQGGEELAYLGLGGSNYTPFGGNYSLNFWNQSPNGPISFGTHNGTETGERLRIDKDGYVGIGTTSPQTKLHVAESYNGYYDALTLNNTNSISSGQGVRLRFQNSAFQNSTETNKFGYIEYGSESNFGEQGCLSFGTNNVQNAPAVERMRIQSNGDVGIGTSWPSYTLHVNGSVAGTSAYNNLSDARLKKDVVNINNGLDKVMALRPVTFNWKQDAYPDMNLDDRNHVGFIGTGSGRSCSASSEYCQR